MCPIVPILMCGLLRSNFSFAIRENASLSRSLALYLADDFLGLRCRDFLVLAEMHGETAAPLRPRAQFGSVSEHGRQRHHRLNNAGGSPQLRGFDPAAPRIQVADHVA